MQNLFGLLFLASLMLFIIGFFSPNASLFWYKKERTRKASALIYGISLFVCLILIGALAPDTKESSDKATAHNKKEVVLTQTQIDSAAKAQKELELENRRKITFTAGQLVSYYGDNEVSADNNFKGKSFYVVGYVQHVGKDILNDTYVTLKSSDFIRNVQCFVEDQDVLAKLQINQKITVYGECDGLMVNVLMKDCKVVENLDADN